MLIVRFVLTRFKKMLCYITLLLTYYWFFGSFLSLSSNLDFFLVLQILDHQYCTLKNGRSFSISGQHFHPLILHEPLDLMASFKNKIKTEISTDQKIGFQILNSTNCKNLISTHFIFAACVITHKPTWYFQLCTMRTIITLRKWC